MPTNLYDMIYKSSLFTAILIIVLVFSATGSALETVTEDNATINLSLSAFPSAPGPDYQVRSVKIPSYESPAKKGDVLHPSLLVKNAGYNDTAGNQVNVSAYLGNYPLLPVVSTFPALMAEQERKITLAYKIPDIISYGGYAFSVTIDPDNLTNDTNTSNNMNKAGVIVMITTPDDDSFIGCEACWAGYR
jgi:hypothetical protein